MASKKERKQFTGLTDEELVRLQEYWVDQLLELSKEIILRKGTKRDPAEALVEALAS